MTVFYLLLAPLAELFIQAGQNAVCQCVWMLTRAAQIIAAAHRDL